MNQQVVFLSDGGDTVRSLQRYLSPESEHLLDWFHITMRLTVMKQMTKGMITELAAQKKPQKEADESENTDVPAQLLKQLESIKWHLWHGNVTEALALIYDVNVDLEIWEENPTNKKKLLKLVCMNLKIISVLMVHLFQTMVIVIVITRPSQRRLWNQRSIM
jgi:hypothetical protein